MPFDLVKPWLEIKGAGMHFKGAKKLALDLYHTQIRPHEHAIVAISGQ